MPVSFGLACPALAIVVVMSLGVHNIPGPSQGLQNGDTWTWFQLHPDAGQEREYKVVVVDDPLAWRLAPLEAVGPMEVKALDFAEGSAIPGGIALRAGKFTSPLVASALQAFPGLTVAYMRLLVKELGMEFKRGARPQSEMQFVEALVKEILAGSYSEQDIKQAIALRKKHVQMGLVADDSELARAANFDLVKDFLDEGDIADAQDMCTKVVQAKQAAASASSSGSGSASSAAASSSVAGSRLAPPAAASGSADVGTKRCPTKRIVPEAAEYSSKDYKEYIPQVVGCSLSLDTLWHNRWVVTYRNKAPPVSHSVSFGPKTGKTVHDALLECLRWAWTSHYGATGEEAPYEF